MKGVPKPGRLKSVKMFRLVLVSALVALVAGAPKVRPTVPTSNERIVGSVDADITEVPYQVSLVQYSAFICGGSLLSTTRVLTAAYCTDGLSPYSFLVRANNRLSSGQRATISRIAQHPQFDRTTLDYDVSVIILDRPLELGPGVQPINLAPIGSELAVGTLATLSGWATSSGSSPAILKKVEVPKVSDASCQNIYGNITDRMTCHGLEEGGEHSCQGDYGGPLAVGQTLVGVLSWGAKCTAAGNPSVYAKVSNADIQNHIIKFL